ncbi:class I SAM-dependent methyltransferase [Paraflavitalea soli]|uniref:Class I SAM-dependent methyltransferase n=1 Tax=Paraflavitalea soli TaxID=2315862 RepID=A0A3B7MFS5_9BACT|nr:class I SAM-dependent methyltransferase [Paraflavitalea soli]AXY73184.1 class I SAM-dependent methyltransferase [Paraflavitalea soli]
MEQSWDEEYKSKWDERYEGADYVYGKAPNLFFKEWLLQFKAGSILMAADGEGRNGVFAAAQGWTVTSFDLSVEGKTKALQLAEESQVSLEYMVGDLEQLHFKPASFDAMALIYAHFAAGKKSLFHRKLSNALKPGGILILEAFSKKHLSFNSLDARVGGPKDIDMLFSKEEILADFEDYEVILLTEEEIHLNEGTHHIGKGAVVRFVGRKRS